MPSRPLLDRNGSGSQTPSRPERSPTSKYSRRTFTLGATVSTLLTGATAALSPGCQWLEQLAPLAEEGGRPVARFIPGGDLELVPAWETAASYEETKSFGNYFESTLFFRVPPPEARNVSAVRLVLHIDHPDPERLAISLFSPQGKKHVLQQGQLPVRGGGGPSTIPDIGPTEETGHPYRLYPGDLPPLELVWEVADDFDDLASSGIWSLNIVEPTIRCVPPVRPIAPGSDVMLPEEIGSCDPAYNFDDPSDPAVSEGGERRLTPITFAQLDVLGEPIPDRLRERLELTFLSDSLIDHEFEPEAVPLEADQQLSFPLYAYNMMLEGPADGAPHFAVEVRVDHPATANVALTLRGPDGTQRALGTLDQSTPTDDGFLRMDLSDSVLEAFSFKSARGRWQLLATDDVGDPQGSIYGWRLRATGPSSNRVTWAFPKSHAAAVTGDEFKIKVADKVGERDFVARNLGLVIFADPALDWVDYTLRSPSGREFSGTVRNGKALTNMLASDSCEAESLTATGEWSLRVATAFLPGSVTATTEGQGCMPSVAWHGYHTRNIEFFGFVGAALLYSEDASEFQLDKQTLARALAQSESFLSLEDSQLLLDASFEELIAALESWSAGSEIAFDQWLEAYATAVLNSDLAATFTRMASLYLFWDRLSPESRLPLLSLIDFRLGEIVDSVFREAVPGAGDDEIRDMGRNLIAGIHGGFAHGLNEEFFGTLSQRQNDPDEIRRQLASAGTFAPEYVVDATKSGGAYALGPVAIVAIKVGAALLAASEFLQEKQGVLVAENPISDDPVFTISDLGGHTEASDQHLVWTSSDGTRKEYRGDDGSLMVVETGTATSPSGFLKTTYTKVTNCNDAGCSTTETTYFTLADGSQKKVIEHCPAGGQPCTKTETETPAPTPENPKPKPGEPKLCTSDEPECDLTIEEQNAIAELALRISRIPITDPIDLIIYCDPDVPCVPLQGPIYPESFSIVKTLDKRSWVILCYPDPEHPESCGPPHQVTAEELMCAGLVTEPGAQPDPCPPGECGPDTGPDGPVGPEPPDPGPIDRPEVEIEGFGTSDGEFRSGSGGFVSVDIGNLGGAPARNLRLEVHVTVTGNQPSDRDPLVGVIERPCLGPGERLRLGRIPVTIPKSIQPGPHTFWVAREGVVPKAQSKGFRTATFTVGQR